MNYLRVNLKALAPFQPWLVSLVANCAELPRAVPATDDVFDAAWAKQVASEMTAVQGALVAGFGMGGHVAQLFAATNITQQILVAEADLGLFRTALERADFTEPFKSGRVFCFAGRGAFEKLFEWFSVGRNRMLYFTGGLRYGVHPCTHLQPAYYEEFNGYLVQAVRNTQIEMNTVVQGGPRIVANEIVNAAVYASSASLDSVRAGAERLRGPTAPPMPAIIVAAGPSLKKNIHLLREAKGRAVLVAVDVVLPPLLALGIVPDFVAMIDYQEHHRRVFDGVDPDVLRRVVLVADPKANADACCAYPGPRAFIQSDAIHLLLPQLPKTWLRVKEGTNVGHLAFQVALALGCDPIAFVGQDLSFPDEARYMPGAALAGGDTEEYLASERKLWTEIPAAGGGTVWTNLQFLNGLRLLVRLIADCGGRHVYNATEGGAQIDGAENTTLAGFLKAHCAREGAARVDWAGIVGEPNWALAVQVLRMLEGIRDDLQRQRPLLEQALAVLAALKASGCRGPDTQALCRQYGRLAAKLDRHRGLFDCLVPFMPGFKLDVYRADRLLVLPDRQKEAARLQLQQARDSLFLHGARDALGRLSEAVQRSINVGWAFVSQHTGEREMVVPDEACALLPVCAPPVRDVRDGS